MLPKKIEKHKKSLVCYFHTVLRRNREPDVVVAGVRFSWSSFSLALALSLQSFPLLEYFISEFSSTGTFVISRECSTFLASSEPKSFPFSMEIEFTVFPSDLNPLFGALNIHSAIRHHFVEGKIKHTEWERKTTTKQKKLYRINIRVLYSALHTANDVR